jgi:hypothetical protein
LSPSKPCVSSPTEDQLAPPSCDTEPFAWSTVDQPSEKTRYFELRSRPGTGSTIGATT